VLLSSPARAFSTALARGNVPVTLRPCPRNHYARYKLTVSVAFLQQTTLSFDIIVATCVVGFGGQTLSSPNSFSHCHTPLL
jgi:hypothetical protein